MHTSTTQRSEVSVFLTKLIEKSGKTRKEIANEAGFEKPSMISMLMKGEARLPITKLGSLAKAVNANPAHLLKLCLREYHSDIWDAMNSHFKAAAVTSDEFRMIKGLRASTGSPYLACLHPDEIAKLDNFLDLVAQSSTVH